MGHLDAGLIGALGGITTWTERGRMRERRIETLSEGCTFFLGEPIGQTRDCPGQQEMADESSPEGASSPCIPAKLSSKARVRALACDGVRFKLHVEVEGSAEAALPRDVAQHPFLSTRTLRQGVKEAASGG
eukprot:scaffold37222_cov28-Tisochrysis_lutea.AAC.2